MSTSETTPLAVHVRRLFNEYVEMPGLRLTGAQAQRLLGLDSTTCSEALQVLVDTGFLGRANGGQYIRRNDGRSTPPLRMAKAQTGSERAGRVAS